MKYLNRYISFLEGKKHDWRKYNVPMWGDNERLDVHHMLLDSEAMQDILALVPEKKHPYDIYKTRTITFSRNFGQRNTVHMNDDGSFTYNARTSDGNNMIETFPDIEDCLRHLWAFLVSRKVISMVTTNYSKESTRKLLLDPEKKRFWGERKTYTEIYNESKLISKEEMDTVCEQLNVAFRLPGLQFTPLSIPAKGGNPEFYGVTLNNILGTLDNSILKAVIKSVFNKKDATATYAGKVDSTKIIAVPKRKQDKSSIYFIQPRTAEEAFVQVCWKVEKIFHTYPNELELVPAGSGKKHAVTFIKSFIEEYAKTLGDAVDKVGFIGLDNEEHINQLIYKGITDSVDAFKLLDALKKQTPDLFDKLQVLGGEKIKTASELGEIGF